jgi:hypothetical protein
LAGLLAAAAVPALPDRAEAHGRTPYNSHGLGWLGSFAYRRMAWIHMNGPLFSYGPYNTPGYLVMHIPQAYHGSYSPADLNLWNMGYGTRGPNVPAPAAGYAPDAVPSDIPPQPFGDDGFPSESFGDGAPPDLFGAVPRYGTLNYMPPRVVPAHYDAVYPAWMTGR